MEVSLAVVYDKNSTEKKLAKPEQVQKALDEAQAKSKVRNIGIWHVEESIKRVEKHLNKIGLPKKLWHGVVVKIDPNAQSFPKAYKYTPEATVFVMERRRGDWYMIALGRERATSKNYTLKSKFTEEQQEAILKEASRIW